MQSLAARGFHPGLEAQVLHELADGQRRVAQRWIGQLGAGIEIEGEPVGMRGLRHHGAPAVQFHRADLRQMQQPFGRIADHEVRILVGVRNLHDAQARARLLEEMLLEERLRAMRVAQDGQRPFLVVRHRVFANRGEVFGELQLGDAVVRKQHAIGMRERGRARRAPPRCAARAFLCASSAQALSSFTTSSVCAGSSRTTVFGSRSCRRPRYRGCRRMPLCVQSANATWITSSGFIQCQISPERLSG